MDAIELTQPQRNRIRLRHALRTALGAVLISTTALHISILSGCLIFILFLVSVGINDNDRYQGTVVHTSLNVLFGALFANIAFALTLLSANQNVIATFFISLPILFLFVTFRTDDRIGLISTIANVVYGVKTISRVGQVSRTDLPSLLLSDFLTTVFPFLMAFLPTLVLYPDRAGDAARHLLSMELRNLGAAISQVATATFSSTTTNHSNHEISNSFSSSQHPHVSIFVENHHQEILRKNFLNEDTIFLTDQAPSINHLSSLTVDRTREMIQRSTCSLQFLQSLRPFGRSRVTSYIALARSRHLFTIATTESCFINRNRFNLENTQLAKWSNITDAISMLVSKAAALESVACLRNGKPSRFSHASLLNFVGKVHHSLWIKHLASCAAACQVLSDYMAVSSFGKPNLQNLHNNHACHQSTSKRSRRENLHSLVNTEMWKRRRLHMYFGLLFRYRLDLRHRDPMEYRFTLSDMSGLESSQLKALNIEYNIHSKNLVTRKANDYENNIKIATESKECYDRELSSSSKNELDSFLQKQALSFFSVTCHAISEEIDHVRRSIDELDEVPSRKFWFSLRFLLPPVLSLRDRMKTLIVGNLHEWELKFFISHWSLLSVTFAIGLFVPPPHPIRRSEMAWVFTSAVLTTQLAAEQTVFISILRILTTIGGTGVGFLFSLFIRTLSSISGSAKWDLLTIPFMGVLTFLTCIAIPLRYRYTAFLICVTCALILFCPRGAEKCTTTGSRIEECLATWEYALTRAITVSAGVILSVLFHVVFFPRYMSDATTKSLSHAIVTASRLLGKIRRTYFSYGLSEGRHDVTGKIANESDIGMESTTRYTADLDDVYNHEVTVLEEVSKKLTVPVLKAMLTVKMQSSLWKIGPLQLYPIIPQLIPDFIALSVSLSELGVLLGRRPVFTKNYTSSLYSQVIVPVLHLYETGQISVRNLVGITERALLDKNYRNARENTFDLNEAITHLARVRSHLRQETSKLIANVRHKYTFHARSTLDLKTNLSSCPEGSIEPAVLRWRDDTYTRCIPGDFDQQVSLDDVVLFNTFSFVADGCLSAFLRIAIAVLIHAESATSVSFAKKHKNVETRHRWKQE